ncbi:MAG: hypothetical protein COB15_06610 [Flavobacteriales bacterium]|nr:MAG: hypothetical protein COB15_06610 [Flavobacteriales bacterium]
MRIANTIIGGFITIVLLFGVLFKMMHWPGSGPMIVLSASLLTLFVYLAAAQNIINFKNKVLPTICNGILAFTSSILIVGFLFKIMHWPGSGLMIVVGITLSSFALLLFIASLIASKETLKLRSGTLFSVMAFGILAFGVSVQGPSYSILTRIVNNNQKAESIILNSLIESDLHLVHSPHAKPYHEALFELHDHIKNLKSKLYEATDGLPQEVADTISLENIWSKDNYDVPTQIMGLADPVSPKKVEGLEEYSGITLRGKIKDFNKKMMVLDSSFDPIKTNEEYTIDGNIDSWETATFYHMPLAQVILTLNLINSEALSKSNYHVTKNYPPKEIKNNKSEE